MSTSLIITLVICATLITLTKLNNDHKAKMAKIQNEKGGNKNE